MVQSWKINREIARLGQQLRGIPELLTDPLAQRRLDQTVAQGLPRLEGDISLSDKLALLLVFQPSGIADSTLETCRWLTAGGYAPFVVSNAPIRPGDRARLASVVWRAVERPNFGYDFGGYRDGLTCLAQWDVAPEELVILNDSVWLPVVPDTDLLARLAAEPAEVAGLAICDQGKRQFLESYFLRIRKRALRHPSFAAFWRDLRLTSNKYYVVRRGERGFSAAMQRAGFGVRGVYDINQFGKILAEQQDTFLLAALSYGAYIDAGFAETRTQLLDGRGPAWRHRVAQHIEQVMAKRLGHASFPFAAATLLRFPVLKKSGDRMSVAWREAFLRAVDAGDLPSPPASVLAEIRARDVGR